MPVIDTSFDPDFASPVEWALMYRGHGVQVVPSYMPSEHPSWKRPALADWIPLQKELAPDFTFSRWYGDHGEHRTRQNMGIVTGQGSGNIFMIDLDTYKGPAAGNWWHSLMWEHNGGEELKTWRQTTGGGGRQIFFRAPASWTPPTNKLEGLNVDIRGQAGFAVLPPSLHSSGKFYTWDEGFAPYEGLEVLEAPQWLLDGIDDLVEDHGGSSGHAPAERTPSPGTDYDAFGNRVDGREEAMRDFVWAVVVDWWRECPIRPPEAESYGKMVEAYEAWERTVKSRLAGADKTADLEREGRGPSAFARKWRRAMRLWDSKVAAAGKEKKPEPKQEQPRPFQAETATVDGLIPIIPAFPIDPKAIERRKWVIRGLLIRSHLSLFVAPAGSGKSLLTLQLSIALAAGMAWGGFAIKKKHRVLVINAEDDVEEMRRRLWAAAETMGVRQEEIADSLFLAERPEAIVIARAEGRKVITTPLAGQLVETVKANGIDAVVVDPFAETFEGDENSNSEVKWAGIAWREIARQTACALLLVHHTRKYANGMAGDADASRGGGALIGTARVVSTLFGMTEDEAKVMDIDPEERGQFVRYDDAKANLSLVTKVAKWFKKETVLLPNGSLSEPADEVGVLVPWNPPGLFEGLSNATINAVLDVIDRGLVDADTGRPTGAFYTHHANSANKARWAGTPIMSIFKCDEDKAKSMIKTWITSGLFREDTYYDGKQDRACIRIENGKRPGTEV